MFEPANADDVSKALCIIADARSHFAVRAGGHMPVRGAQSVQPGVMIALSSLNRRTLSRNKAIASIGPGQTWGDVYAWLAPYGLAVNGGRYSPVGVGGLLLAGGIGFWGSRFGWGADSVVGYEVVLPNGRIVEVTANGPDKDLFWALKGGHNHFGIVTRFDMTTFAAGPAFIRTVVWNLTDSPATTDAFFSALNTYTAPGGGAEDPNVAIMPIVAISPGISHHEVIMAQIAFGTDPNPPPFRGFNAIEGPEVLDNDGGKVYDSWTYLPFAAGELFGARDFRQAFHTVSFKPDPRAISIANRTVVDLAKRVLPATATVAFTYQPISKQWLQASRAAGGDAMDLDPRDGPFIAGLLSTQWVDAADDALMTDFAHNVTSAIERETKALGVHLPFKYLGDSGEGQNPFSTYGGGKSQAKLQRIQKHYDPKAFFKTFLGHGFPL